MILFDSFGDFFEQIPPILIIEVCFSGILLFAAFAWFAFFKPRRRKRQMKDMQPEGAQLVAAPEPAPQTAQPAVASRRFDDDQLPDLDLLVESAAVNAAPYSSPLAPAGASRIRLHTGETITTKPVLSILRDVSDDRLVVYVDNEGYRTLADSPAVREHFVKIMRELSDVITKSDVRAVAPPDAPVDEAQPEKPPAPARPPRTPLSPAAPPPISPDGAMPGDLPTYNLDEAVKPEKSGMFGRVKYEPVPLPEFNLAGSIEAYLQHKLRHTPDYAGRVIHIHTAPGGGVRIEVDGVFYDAVSDVADREIKAFLTETIQEWHERQ